ncbi:MAG: hypothetical protein QW244_03290 [Candidatus Pacearchaeota archaeon]
MNMSKISDTSYDVEKGKSKNNLLYTLIGLMFIIAILLVYNQFQISSIAKKISSNSAQITGFTISDIIPTGVPPVYGSELGIRYDDVSPNNPRLADETIAKLGSFDNKITLSGEKLQRYIEIGLQISCEYCCGAAAIIFKDGSPACGCAHSYAMRGLAKYLLTYHPEMSNEQILEELGKWKVLFFPGIHEQKAAVLKEKGIELNYINLASNKYRGIERGTTSGGEMVGGC